MKKDFKNNIVLIFCLLGAAFWCFLYFQKKTYPIERYFPLHENDNYTFVFHEGQDQSLMNLTVKNVRQAKAGKEFEYVWEGKYNDRIQTFILNSKGLLFLKNKHLTGEFPLKSIRTHTPPLLMVPSVLKKNIMLSSVYSTYDYDGNLYEQEDIEANITFLGKEEIEVGAGIFKSLHFFIWHNYKDRKDVTGKSKYMHMYHIWIASEIGIIKFVHTFMQLTDIVYFKPEQKNLMNRYNTIFSEVFELKNAVIGGKIIGKQ